MVAFLKTEGENMGKMMETKREILNRLKGGRATVSQLSEELGLAKSTVSQHLTELKDMGAIEEDDNHYFRRLKYFKLKGDAKQNPTPVFNTVWVGAIAVVAVAALFVAIYSLGGLVPYLPHGLPQNHLQNVSSNSTLPAITSNGGPAGPAGAAACPLLLVYPTANYSSVSTIIGHVANASPCYMTYINVSSSTIRVGQGVKFTSLNGTLSVPSVGYTYSLTAGQLSVLENYTAQGYCWAYDTLAAFGVNATHPSQCRANIYS